jgi:HK97 family phage prohead protease
MPVKLGEREYRAMALMAPPSPEQRKLIESDFYVEGYATTFDKPYVLWGDYKEIIDRHALDGADMTNVIMQYDHGGRVLARMTNATLVLRADDHGLLVGADLSKSEAARSLYEEIKNGLVTKMSWAFTVDEDSYDYESDTRTILRVKKVFDVAPVSLPANDATDISARSYVDEVDARRRSDRARKAHALKLRARIDNERSKA